MNNLDEDIKKLKEQESRVLLRLAAAKLALLVDEGNVKVDECLKTINEGNELIRRIRDVLKAYN